jgi:hypothetical protein
MAGRLYFPDKSLFLNIFFESSSRLNSRNAEGRSGDLGTVFENRQNDIVFRLRLLRFFF